MDSRVWIVECGVWSVDFNMHLLCTTNCKNRGQDLCPNPDTDCPTAGIIFLWEMVVSHIATAQLGKDSPRNLILSPRAKNGIVSDPENMQIDDMALSRKIGSPKISFPM